jgi:hypothetical protein
MLVSVLRVINYLIIIYLVFLMHLLSLFTLMFGVLVCLLLEVLNTMLVLSITIAATIGFI